MTELRAVGVESIVNAGVGGLLVAGDVGLGGKVVGVVTVDVEMVGLNMKNDGNVRRALEVPELEAAKLVDDEVVGLDLIQDVKGGLADVADQPDFATEGGEQVADEGAGGAFALGAGDADDAGGRVGEEILGDAGPVTEGRHGGAAEDKVVGGEILGFEVGGSDGIKNGEVGAAGAEIGFNAVAFLAVTEDSNSHRSIIAQSGLEGWRLGGGEVKLGGEGVDEGFLN